MPEFDPTTNGVAGDTFVLLPDGQPWVDAGEYDIWLSQVTADYSILPGAARLPLTPGSPLVPHVDLMPSSG